MPPVRYSSQAVTGDSSRKAMWQETQKARRRSRALLGCLDELMRLFFLCSPFCGSFGCLLCRSLFRGSFRCLFCRRPLCSLLYRRFFTEFGWLAGSSAGRALLRRSFSARARRTLPGRGFLGCLFGGSLFRGFFGCLFCRSLFGWRFALCGWASRGQRLFQNHHSLFNHGLIIVRRGKNAFRFLFVLKFVNLIRVQLFRFSLEKTVTHGVHPDYVIHPNASSASALRLWFRCS